MIEIAHFWDRGDVLQRTEPRLEFAARNDVAIARYNGSRDIDVRDVLPRDMPRCASAV